MYMALHADAETKKHSDDESWPQQHWECHVIPSLQLYLTLYTIITWTYATLLLLLPPPPPPPPPSLLLHLYFYASPTSRHA